MTLTIKDIDQTQADWNEGTLTDVVAVDDKLELANNPALSFDGVDDKLEVIQPSFTDVITVELWIYVRNSRSDTYDPIILCDTETSGDSRVRFFNYNEPWTFHVEIQGNDVNLSAPVKLGEWIHYALVVDPGNTAYIYENGVIVDSGSCPSGSLNFGTNFLIGATPSWYVDAPNSIDGIVDEVRFWNSVRTQQQIQDNMYKELTGSETGLVAYYKMNEGTGSTLTDSAGNNDGTINGATWVTDGHYFNGTRLSPQIDLQPAGQVASSLVEWDETPNSQSINIETRHSLDGGSSWSSWQQATNGEAIPGLTSGTDVSNGLLECRQVLSTQDPNVTPELQSLAMSVTGDIAHGDTVTYSIDNTIEENTVRDSDTIGLSIVEEAIVNAALSDVETHTLVLQDTANQAIAGVRESLPYDLSTLPDVDYATIEWREYANGQRIQIETSYTLDGVTWSEWTKCTNRGYVPGLENVSNTSNAAVKIKQTLASFDGATTPILYDVMLTVASSVDRAVFEPGADSTRNNTANDVLTGGGRSVAEWGATNDQAWRSPEDTSKIDGGNIYAGSKIQVGNLDGTSDYCLVESGDISFYSYINGEHHFSKSLKRIEVGIGNDGESIEIPGYWKQPPKIIAVPYAMKTYNPDFPGQTQMTQCIATNIREFATGRYGFELEVGSYLSAPSFFVNLDETYNNTHEDAQGVTDNFITSTYTTQSGITEISFEYEWECKSVDFEGTEHCVIDVYIYINVDGEESLIEEQHFAKYTSELIRSGDNVWKVSVPADTHNISMRANLHTKSDGSWAGSGKNYFSWKSYKAEAINNVKINSGSARWIAIGE